MQINELFYGDSFLLCPLNMIHTYNEKVEIKINTACIKQTVIIILHSES